MEVQQHDFPLQLLNILESISAADFVAIDCEFSGVARKTTSAADGGKQTIQERYLETKAAAEKYQVLQLGLTCAVASSDRKSFTFSTYNIPISPILDEELRVPRDFTLQSGAIQFLLCNNFSIETPLKNGVKYLSRREEKLACNKISNRLETYRIPDVEIATDDLAGQEFMQYLRSTISQWLASNESSLSDSFLFFDMRPATKHTPAAGLTSSDRRLVHQLVRAEYPALASFTKNTVVTVRQKNHKREREILTRKRNRMQQEIDVHIGCRWIIDALCGGSTAHLDIKAMLSSQEHVEYDFYQISRQHSRVRETLKPSIIVGHNVFVDLVHLYGCFIGPLPNSVEEFAVAIDLLFCAVIDTKYMATQDCGTTSSSSSLDTVDGMTKDIESPIISMQQGFSKYEHDNEARHEAGFDSMITARVLLRLASSQANADGQVPDFASSFWTTLKNKLRVFGTIESLLDINQAKERSVSTVELISALQALEIAKLA